MRNFRASINSCQACYAIKLFADDETIYYMKWTLKWQIIIVYVLGVNYHEYLWAKESKEKRMKFICTHFCEYNHFLLFSRRRCFPKRDILQISSHRNLSLEWVDGFMIWLRSQSSSILLQVYESYQRNDINSSILFWLERILKSKPYRNSNLHDINSFASVVISFSFFKTGT